MNTQRRYAPLASIVALALLVGCAPDQEGHEGHTEDDGHEADPHAGEAEGAHEEGHVELTERQFKSAGIVVSLVESGTVSETVTLPGTVARNADAVLHVTPRVSGQIRTALKQLGDSVEPGDLLCVLDSVELGDAVADYLSDLEMAEAAEETLARGRVLYERRLAALEAVLNGAIAVHERIFEREDELQKKAVSTLRPLLEADKALQLSKLNKDERLTELTAERDTRLLELEVAARSKKIALSAAKNRLRTMGLGPEDLQGLNEDSPLLSGEYTIRAPGKGVVVTRHISTGEFVEAGTEIYIIEDLSSVWFVASVYEEQLRSVRLGQSALVRLDAFPSSPLVGTVSFLDYSVDVTSRSVGVRITLNNERLETWDEDLPLRPGLFGRAELETTSRQAAAILPERALVHEDAGDYVFVQIEPFGFERRNVVVNHVSGDRVEIISGLEAGEAVATSGTFFLKSAERQAELGGGHSH